MEANSDISLLLQHGHLILQNAKKILETPEYALAAVEGAKFGSTMVEGGALNLGTVLILWGYSDLPMPPLPSGEQAPLWKIQDSENNDTLHIFYMSGNLGSGSNSYSAFSFDTQKIVSGSVEGFGAYFSSASSAMKILKDKYGKQSSQYQLAQVIEQLEIS